MSTMQWPGWHLRCCRRLRLTSRWPAATPTAFYAIKVWGRMLASNRWRHTAAASMQAQTRALLSRRGRAVQALMENSRCPTLHQSHRALGVQTRATRIWTHRVHCVILCTRLRRRRPTWADPRSMLATSARAPRLSSRASAAAAYTRWQVICQAPAAHRLQTNNTPAPVPTPASGTSW